MSIETELALLNQTKQDIKASIEAQGVAVGAVPFADYTQKIATIEQPEPWIRNPAWPNISTAMQSDETRGLYAVWPNISGSNPGNWIAIGVTGDAFIEWGDGTGTTVSNGTVEKTLNYNDIMPPANAPAIFVETTQQISCAEATYTNGQRIRFYNISGTSGIVEDQVYYVINANTTGNVFQISDAPDSSPIVFTGDGEAELLPYRTVVVSIRSQSGSTVTGINFNVGYSSAPGPNSSGWLEIVAKNDQLTSFQVGSNVPFVRHSYLEKVSIENPYNIITFFSMFHGCIGLKEVFIGESSPLSATDFQNMFSECKQLINVNKFNTANATNMRAMFNACHAIKIVPEFNTANVTTMRSMFYDCFSLRKVPKFNTQSMQSFRYTFGNCFSLVTIPLLDTGNATELQGMFYGCKALVSVPSLNTQNASDMSFMFTDCWSLTIVPKFNTQVVTTWASIFANCYSLSSVPSMNTFSVSTFQLAFSNCWSLSSIGSLDMSSASNLNNTFDNCYSLQDINAYGMFANFTVNQSKLSSAALNKLYDALSSTVASASVTVSNNWGYGDSDTSIATAKNWTVL